jgi:hypothetical protein
VLVVVLSAFALVLETVRTGDASTEDDDIADTNGQDQASATEAAGPSEGDGGGEADQCPHLAVPPGDGPTFQLDTDDHGCTIAAGTFIEEGVTETVTYNLTADATYSLSIDVRGANTDFRILDPAGATIYDENRQKLIHQFTPTLDGTYTIELTPSYPWGGTTTPSACSTSPRPASST